MKPQRTVRRAIRSSSELSGSSVCSKSNRDVSKKETSFDVLTYGGGDPISVDETSNEIERYAEESHAARTSPQWSIDNNVKTKERLEIDTSNEMSSKMYQMNKLISLLNCKYSKTKNPIDDQLQPTDLMVEKKSRFDRYDAEDSRSFSSDRENNAENSRSCSGDRDGEAATSTSFSSSWLPSSDSIISDGRYLFPGKPAGTVQAMTIKKVPKKRGRKKTIRRSTHPKGGRDSVDGTPSEVLLLSSGPNGFGDDFGKYFTNSSAAFIQRKKREQQIKDVYAATPEKNTRAPVAMARRTTDRSHQASSYINRKIRSREITRTNKIIADKILNVRMTIPKTKK
ncbi:uncharacterized protein LOC114130523 [Aphis gossypii]|uniref:uncharacterized protein LOC114130523 n=1 Tax=Aphis gossypii TaxID=80765 RepID=UPI0021593EF7|nr:uncharacterized protein LOC114130523 [Aphis gossypii]